MNLHSNQIQFSATRPTHVQFAHEENRTAAAVQALTDVVVRGMEAKAQTDDEIFASQMNTAMNSGLKAIDDAKELNANYDAIGQEAISNYTKMLESAPEDVRTRFLRRNPTAIEDYTLRVDASVALKIKTQLYNKLTNEIPRLASEVVLAPKDKQEALYKTNLSLLQNPNLDVTQVDNLTHELNKLVDRGKIASAIAQKDWSKALALLDNDDVSLTVSPAERMNYKHNIEDAIKAEQKALAEEAEKKLKGEDEKTKALEATIMEAFNTLVSEGRYEDAKKFQSDFVSGEPLYSVTGAKIGDSSAFSRTAKMELSGKMNTSYGKAPGLEYFAAEVQQEYFDMTRPILNDDGNPTNTKVDLVSYSNARALYDSPAKFASLSAEQQGVVTKIVTGYDEMVTESLYPVDYFVQVPILQERAVGDSRMAISPVGDVTPLLMEQIAKRAELSGIPYSFKDLQGNTVVIKPRTNKLSAPQEIEGSFYNMTKVFNERNILGVEVKPGTRASSVLYLALGLGMNSHTVSSSLTNAGAPKATANMLSGAMVQQLNYLLQSGEFDSENISRDTVTQDLNDLLFRINGHDRAKSDVEKITQDSIVDVVLMGVTNPLEMKVRDFKNIEEAYPTQAIGKYVYADTPRTEAQIEERDKAVKAFQKRNK